MSTRRSPFKFLDAYQEQDIDIFFGREKETEELYEALSGVKHLLVYGPSGAGKTSLIECGLRNQFSDADWYALTIRKGANINASVFAQINAALKNQLDPEPASQLPSDPDRSFGDAIEQLFAKRYQPIYLLFDQFEELLISGGEGEKVEFFQRLDRLIRQRIPCRVLLVMREEFIGHLFEFELHCPSIFQYRYRLEKMGRRNVYEVIRKTLQAPKYNSAFAVTNSEVLAELILSRLPDQRREIELSHVQVFLSELWERAVLENGQSDRPVLRAGLVQEADQLEGILDSFLKRQLKELGASYGQQVPLEVLACMISERHTKLQLSVGEVEAQLTQNQVTLNTPLYQLIQELERRRIVRSLRSGERIQYEISHDTLAQVVGQNLTEEMQMRERAREVYRVYDDKQGLLSPEDLDFLRPYQAYLPYPKRLAGRVMESRAENERRANDRLREAEAQAERERGLRKEAEGNARRARIRTRVAAGVAIVALFLAGLAGLFFRNAQTQRRIAQEQEQEAIKLADLAIQREQTADSLRRLAETQTDSIQQVLDRLQVATTARVEAETARDQAEEEAEAERKKQVATMVEDIKNLLAIGDKVGASKIWREAKALDPNNPNLQRLENLVRQ